MPVITITITESSEQLISGIPTYVMLDTNVPTTIFYTLDGTDPDTTSLIYLGGKLNLPTNQTTLILKIFATDGIDSSPIIERTYRPNITVLRQSHDQVTDLGNTSNKSSFPYGDLAPELPGIYSNFGPDNLIVDKSSINNIFDGYDGTATGTPTGGTDQALENYLLRYSESNSLGERARGIGTLPSTTTLIESNPPPVSTNMNDKFFDPRALVIFQDSREEPFDSNILQTNRQFFSLEDSNSEKIRDGILLNTTAFEGLAPTGSFLRAHYNPTENTTTYYYHDSRTLRWIISKEPAPRQNPRTGVFNILFSSRTSGDRFVFRWIPFKGSRLI